MKYAWTALVLVASLAVAARAGETLTQPFESKEGLAFANEQGGYRTANPRMEVTTDAAEGKGALHVTFDCTGKGGTGGSCCVFWTIKPVDMKNATMSLKVKRSQNCEFLQIGLYDEAGKRRGAMQWAADVVKEPAKWTEVKAEMKDGIMGKTDQSASTKIVKVALVAGTSVPLSKDVEAWFDDLKIEVPNK